MGGPEEKKVNCSPLVISSPHKPSLCQPVCLMNFFYFHQTHIYNPKAFWSLPITKYHNIKQYCDIL